MPEKRTVEEEVELAARKNMYLKVVKKYKDENCDEKGRVKHDNLTKEQRQGLKSLTKLVKDGEIVIRKTNKGKNWSISSLESYQRQGEEHTKDDKEAEWEEVKLSQKTVNSHGRAFANIIKVGQGVGDNNAKRCFTNISSEACSVPILDIYPKNHKKRKENGDPKTWGVVGASNSMMSRTANAVGEIVEISIKACKDKSLECISTEEVLAYLEDMNMVVGEEGEDIVVGSVDAEALYPSLNIPQVARMCADKIE